MYRHVAWCIEFLELRFLDASSVSRSVPSGTTESILVNTRHIACNRKRRCARPTVANWVVNAAMASGLNFESHMQSHFLLHLVTSWSTLVEEGGRYNGSSSLSEPLGTSILEYSRHVLGTNGNCRWRYVKSVWKSRTASSEASKLPAKTAGCWSSAFWSVIDSVWTSCTKASKSSEKSCHMLSSKRNYDMTKVASRAIRATYACQDI